MVNKEFFIGGGAIVKDFENRNIPQNSHNYVNVSVFIPVSEFNDNEATAVEIAFSKQLKGQYNTDTLPSLICASAKTIKYNGIDYIKWECQLSINYTNFVGTLFLTPYIIKTIQVEELDENEETITKTYITKQVASTTTQLNVIKGVENTTDASLEETEAVDYLEGLINAKHIMTIVDFKDNDLTTAINGCFENYVSTYYSGWLLIVKYNDGVVALFPYQDNGDNAYTMIKMDGSVSKLYGYTSSPQAFNELQLTYTKGEIDTILTSYYTKSETYSDDEVDALLDTKVNKTFELSGHALNGASLQLHPSDVELGNVANNTTINSPTENANSSWVSAGGLYTYLRANYYTQGELDSTIAKVNELYALYKDATPDNDAVVNTLYDLVQVFSNFPESSNIASIFSGIDSRLDALEELDNVVVNCGSTTLLSSGWTSNSGDYSSDYPYKITYQNDLLKGATNFSVIFGVDADTSVLSTTAVLNNETGVITFYASEEPSDNIAIENIVAFTNMNAINTLTTQTINQVQQNKNDISDLQSTKISKSATSGLVKNDGTIDTNYVKERNSYYNNGTYTKYIENKDNVAEILLRVVAPDYSNHQIYAGGNLVCMEDMYKATSTKNLVSSVLLQNGKAKIINSTWESGEKTAEHTLEFDEDGNLTLDGNAVGGGGSQLYQHNIRISNSTDNLYGELVITSTSDTAFSTMAQIASYLVNYGTTKWYPFNGYIAYSASGVLIFQSIKVEGTSSSSGKFLKGVTIDNGVVTATSSYQIKGLWANCSIDEDSVITL